MRLIIVGLNRLWIQSTLRWSNMLKDPYCIVTLKVGFSLQSPDAWIPGSFPIYPHYSFPPQLLELPFSRLNFFNSMAVNVPQTLAVDINTGVASVDIMEVAVELQLQAWNWFGKTLIRFFSSNSLLLYPSLALSFHLNYPVLFCDPFFYCFSYLTWKLHFISDINCD